MPYTNTLNYLNKPRSGIAHGGIGSGSIELRQDGVFYNWSIFNNFPFGSGPAHHFDNGSMLFFIVRYQEQGKAPRIKLLQIDSGYYVAGIQNHIYEFPWLTGIEQIEYNASFPFTRLKFTDQDMPFTIEMEVFHPFIPHDVKHSALPAVIFNFAISSHSSVPVDVMLMGTLRNSAAYDVLDKDHLSQLSIGDSYQQVQMSCARVAVTHSSFGTQSLLSQSVDGSYELGWTHRHPFYETVLRHVQLPNQDNTASHNGPDLLTGAMRTTANLFSSLAVSRQLAPGASLAHTFITAWHFPNLYAQSALGKEGGSERLEGHYYTRYFDDAAAVASYVWQQRDDLEMRTRQFHDNFFASSVEPFVLDQINSQLNTFATSSWLTRDGHFGIQEGITPETDWGPLATIDVALYGGLMTMALFPELDRAMIHAHAALQSEFGQISHGIPRDFNRLDLDDRKTGRVDLPAQYVILALRHYFWTGDEGFLQEIWPSVEKALDYTSRERDDNGDGLPDMTGINCGCSYDNFPMWGASSYVSSLWLSALHYAILAALHLHNEQATRKYSMLLERAQSQFDKLFWNGAYYRLYNDQNTAESQLDEGCMTDQLIGQWANHWVGLGDLVDQKQRCAALLYIFNHAYEPGLGLRNCVWLTEGYLHEVPPGWWYDQANTFWSGVELGFAALLIRENLVSEGLQIVQTVNERYQKAGRYFDHQEWGGHYYRPMAAWDVLNAVLGLEVQAGHYTFAPKIASVHNKLFFAFANGTAFYEHDLSAARIMISVETGTWRCTQLTLNVSGVISSSILIRVAHQSISPEIFRLTTTHQTIDIVFYSEFILGAGQVLELSII